MTLFTTFLVVYLIILVANLRMIVLVRTDPQLHTSMYFFLSHLSFSDLCYSTAIGLRMLAGFLIKNKSEAARGGNWKEKTWMKGVKRYKLPVIRLASSRVCVYSILTIRSDEYLSHVRLFATP